MRTKNCWKIPVLYRRDDAQTAGWTAVIENIILSWADRRRPVSYIIMIDYLRGEICGSMAI